MVHQYEGFVSRQTSSPLVSYFRWYFLPNYQSRFHHLPVFKSSHRSDPHFQTPNHLLCTIVHPRNPRIYDLVSRRSGKAQGAKMDRSDVCNLPTNWQQERIFCCKTKVGSWSFWLILRQKVTLIRDTYLSSSHCADAPEFHHRVHLTTVKFCWEIGNYP